MPCVLAPGLLYRPAFLAREAQAALVEDLRAIVRVAPLYTPIMPRTGKEFSVRMTNCGPLGWVSDRDGGYRYQPFHPVTGAVWPATPPLLLRLWEAVADFSAPPDACLVNYYAVGARMGLHVDQDENELRAPIVSLSLGASCLFRYGGPRRSDPTKSLKLHSGDVLVIGGPSRLCHHGVDRILPGASTLLAQDARINITMRRVAVASVCSSAREDS